jgi:hypothetical protein
MGTPDDITIRKFIRGWFEKYPDLMVGCDQVQCFNDINGQPLEQIVEDLGSDKEEFIELVALGQKLWSEGNYGPTYP